MSRHLTSLSPLYRRAVCAPAQAQLGASLRQLSTSSPAAASTATLPAVDPGLQPREWLVIIPDNEGVLQRRYQVRPKHSENFRRLHREGYVSWAGPVFSQPCKRGTAGPALENRPFMGSVMVVRDVSREAIYQRLSTDLFITEGIWNWDKAKVLPFSTVMRQPPSTVVDLFKTAAPAAVSEVVAQDMLQQGVQKAI